MKRTILAAATSAGVLATAVLAGALSEAAAFHGLPLLGIVGYSGGLIGGLVAIGTILGATFYAAANS